MLSERSCPPSIQSNAGFQSKFNLIQTNSDPNQTKIWTKITVKFFRHLISAALHFMKIGLINFLQRRSLTNLFLEPQTKLNSSNHNNFYILTSNTITDKCTLVKDLRVNFFNRVFFSPLAGFLSEPWRNLYMFISCRYLIPNDWN